MNKVIGTCSNCGGRVTIPDVWYGVVPPAPTCDGCGATKAQSFGPVIQMDPPRQTKAIGTWLDGTSANHLADKH